MQALQQVCAGKFTPLLSCAVVADIDCWRHVDSCGSTFTTAITSLHKLFTVCGQEERQLREELAAKEALLQACTERLADWQARCERLAAKHRGASAL